MMKAALEGVLPILKPTGWTSHDVVAKARRILGVKRIGHTGTLDPAVTGVLPLCVGRATRFVEYLQDLPKQYEAVLVIGIATDTEDMEGTIVAQSDDIVLTEAQIREALFSFQGEIDQVPPMYSAVKVDGKRLYELAREGKEVERKSRRVTIYELELLSTKLSGGEGFPEIAFRVTCSKGTYIRTLCVDIGRRLGFPAAMKSLVRTQTGNFSLSDCVTLEQLAELASKGEAGAKLIPGDQAIGHLPAIKLTAEQSKHGLQGRKLYLNANQFEQLEGLETERIIRAYDSNGDFLGLFQWQADLRQLTPHKIFSESPATSV